MSIIDKISTEAKEKNIVSDQQYYSTNPSLLNDNQLQVEDKFKLDPSPNILSDVDDQYSNGNIPFTGPLDLRSSQNTGKLIHNWWIYYLKSLKKFLVDSFDDSVNNFEFNYANKGVLLKKLYNQINVNNPSCIINISSFRTESNLDSKRRNSGFYNLDQTTVLARNYTRNLEVRVDFKFVNITQEIVINFDDATDVLNYYDRFTTVYPLNKDFINYDYKTLINIHNETKGWELIDSTDGIIYDAAILGNDNHAGPNGWVENKNPQRWGQYICCPQFSVTSVEQFIDKQSQKYSLRISLNTLLRVPQTIITRIPNEINIKAIQVVLDIGTDNKLLVQNNNETVNVLPETNLSSLEKPICIDIDRDIYNTYKMENILYLSGKINFDKVNGKLILPTYLQPALQNKAAALYIIDDSTINDPELFWVELGFLYSINSEIPLINLNEQNLLNDYKLETRTDSYLKSIGIDLEYNWKPGLSDTNNNPIPEPEINTLEINIPNYDSIRTTLDNKIGPWFDARLFLFNVNDGEL